MDGDRFIETEFKVETEFEKIWSKDFLGILDYVDRIHNRFQLYEILSMWEKTLAEWIETGKDEELMSDERKLFAALFDNSSQKILEDIREALNKMTS